MPLRNFIISQFKYAKTKYSVRNINNIKGVIYCDKQSGTVFQASQAMHYGFDKHTKSIVKIYDWLADTVYNYLNNTNIESKHSFDSWHHDACSNFVEKCHKIGLTGTAYGLAQKFVNITLKYCYCFYDANIPEKLHKFDFCHVALDGFTYCPSTSSRNTGIYKKYSKPSRAGFLLPFYTENVAKTIPIKNLTAWSKLDYDEYIKIQDDIFNFLTKQPVTYSTVAKYNMAHLSGCSLNYRLTPFQTEFFLW